MKERVDGMTGWTWGVIGRTLGGSGGTRGWVHGRQSRADREKSLRRAPEMKRREKVLGRGINAVFSSYMLRLVFEKCFVLIELNSVLSIIPIFLFTDPSIILSSILHSLTHCTFRTQVTHSNHSHDERCSPSLRLPIPQIWILHPHLPNLRNTAF